MKKIKKHTVANPLSAEKQKNMDALVREFERKYNEAPSTPESGSQPNGETV
jgi:hypothetical protein